MDVESLAKQLILKGMTEEQQKAVLDSIKGTMEQSRTLQKQRVGEQATLVIQALKKIEADILTRYDELGNKIVQRVDAIKDGVDGRNGVNGKDGRAGRDGATGPAGQRGADGLNGRDGRDGADGVSVTDAHIDFDGSLIISLSNGRVLNVGEVVAPDLAEKIKVITNGGGTSQQVLDTLVSLQTQINNIYPSQTGNAGKFLQTNGTTVSWGNAVGGLAYQGTWNATTNTPTLASGVGTNGYYYITATAGSTNLDGITDWQIGDWLLFNGTVWQKIDQSNLVTSVNGQTGVVVLSTTDVAEGSRLYYTDARARAAISAGTGISYNNSTGVVTNSAPDQTVVLMQGGTTTISGTYPNFTVTSNDQFAGTVTSVSGTGSYGGLSLSGTVTSSGSLTLGGTPTGTWPISVSGSAASATTATTLQTSRTIQTNLASTASASFDGSANITPGVTGTLPVANGGTGATTRQDAMDALAGATTSGQYLRGNGTDVVMSAIQAADVPTLNQDTTGNATTATTATNVSGGTASVTTLAVNGNNISSANSLGFRNRIINGDMRIDQRNAGASVTANSGSDFYAVDRWPASGESADGVFTVQRSTTVPTGFVNSLICTVTTADSSIGATQRYFVEHKVEGFNTADLGFGTANAQSITLSFWVRSSVTGTFGGTVSNASGRYYPFSYTISAANTFEQKTVTIGGDTTGTWNTGNGMGIELLFSLGCGSSRKGTAGAWTSSVFLAPTGSVDLIATSGATFYITGVQLEAGSVATPFERRPYGTELALCQRYYQIVQATTRFLASAGSQSTSASLPFQTTMRSAPTAVVGAAAVTTNVSGSTSISRITAYGADSNIVSAAGGDCFAVGTPVSLTAEL